MSKKILDLNLIENKTKKKKKIDNNLNLLKEELINIINSLIFIDNNSKCKINESQNFIKNNLVKFIELYININRNMINLNENNKIVRELVNTLIDDVLLKLSENKNTEILKVIDLNKEKIKIEKYKNINMLN